MTEHFTREEAVALVRERMGTTAATLLAEEFTDLLNTAITAKLKEWEAQGAVMFAFQHSDGSWHDASETEHSVGMKPLYTHAQAAHPAEPVNAELVEALGELCDIVEGVVQDIPAVSSLMDSFTTQPARAALSRARSQAAPAVGVPDSCIWTPDADYETDIHYSACGEAWSFIEGGPTENNVRFCQGCGKPVVIASAQPQQKEG